MDKNKDILLIDSKQFTDVVEMIRNTRNQVMQIANTALIDLYWNVGKYLSAKIASAEWGDGVVKQLALHIEKNCPDIKGFSDKNMWRMKQFYESYASASEKLSPLVRQISWTNNLIILSRVKSAEERVFYLQKCISERYSKRELNRQIDSALYERTMTAQPKLSPALREFVPQAEQLFRDNYVMEFITGKESKPENSLRRASLSRSLSPTMVAEYQLCLPDKKLLQQKMHEIMDGSIEEQNTIS